MQKRQHIPSIELIDAAVVAAFNTSVEVMNSRSRRTEAVVPREAKTYLLRTRAKLSIPEIVTLTGYPDRMVKTHLQHVRERLTVDHDFYMRVLIAELMIIQQSFRVGGSPGIIFSFSDQPKTTIN